MQKNVCAALSSITRRAPPQQQQQSAGLELSASSSHAAQQRFPSSRKRTQQQQQQKQQFVPENSRLVPIFFPRLETTKRSNRALSLFFFLPYPPIILAERTRLCSTRTTGTKNDLEID